VLAGGARNKNLERSTQDCLFPSGRYFPQIQTNIIGIQIEDPEVSKAVDAILLVCYEPPRLIGSWIKY
jgi:hypothetical protein